MLSKKYFLIIFLSLCINQLLAQKTNTSIQYSIPFKFTPSNNLSIRAILNQKDTVELMFHLAASAITLTEDALKKLKNITFNRTDSVSSWGGRGNISRYSETNHLQIGEMAWKNVPIWENKNSGPGTDGKFGLDLFKDKIVNIRFEENIILIQDELPKNIKKYQKLRIDYHDDMMFIFAQCEVGKASLSNKFLIHSGYAGSILFDDQFSNMYKLSEQLKITSEKQLKDSYGNVLKTKKAILSSFTLGNFQLKNIPVGFFDGAIGRQKMSILGGDVLKRFDLIIDAKREFIYIKPNNLIKTPYLDV